MMRSVMSRHLRRALLSTPTLKPQKTIIPLPRHLTTTTPFKPPTKPHPWSHPYPQPHRPFSMKHQEIEGETVTRDLSPLANETRQVTQSLIKTMYQLSKSLAALALVQLTIGAYLSLTASRTDNFLTLTSSAVAFGVPFAMAILIRQSVKGMAFFDKMDQIGRLQILTATMQVSKQVGLFFGRVKGVTVASGFGLVLALLYSVLVSGFSRESVLTEEEVKG